jgi:hypothetical protein
MPLAMELDHLLAEVEVCMLYYVVQAKLHDLKCLCGFPAAVAFTAAADRCFASAVRALEVLLS